MQPHYLPWPGYFNLMSKVNKFIFLDDVQFSKSSWQSRNQICINNNKKRITIPTTKSTLKTNINKKLISNLENWKAQQLKTISLAYSNHYFFKDLEELILFIKKTYSEFGFKVPQKKYGKISKKDNFSKKYKTGRCSVVATAITFKDLDFSTAKEISRTFRNLGLYKPFLMP